MPYAKGQSGNPKGRPKQTAEQKSQKEQFQRLLKSSTVEALQSIIQIANDRYNKDRFNACSKSSAEQAFDRLKESELKEAEQGLASVYMQGFHLRNIEKQVNAFKKPSAWNPDEQTA